jgi:hypothetical protein
MGVEQENWIVLRADKQAVLPSIDPARLDMPIQLSEAPSTQRRRKQRSPISPWQSTRSVPATVVEYWSNLVANRQMWNEAGVDVGQLAHQCRETLRILLEVDEGGLQSLDAAVCVEVSIPFRSDEPDAARAFPWEFVITNATKLNRGNLQATIVLRRLRVEGQSPIKAPTNFCFIESAPSPFDRIYGFDLEYMEIQRNLALADYAYERIRNPSLSELRTKLAEKHWDAVHVTGLDVHQGVEILKAHRWEEESPLVRAYEAASQLTDGRVTRPPDGIVILNEVQQLDCLPAKEFATILKNPMLITMNLYYSAANLAPLTVANGANAALGFQDTFDDDLVDKFFATFYLAWKLANGNLLTAFAYTLRELLPVATASHARADLGVVLWTRASLLEGET